MRPFLLLLFSILFCFSAFAQDYFQPKNRTLYYSITNAEAKAFLAEELAAEELVNSRATQAIAVPEDSLPRGQFLAATLKGEKVTYQYAQQNTYQVEVFTYEKKLAIMLFSLGGDSIRSAEILADGKRVKWSAAAQAYLRRDWRVDQLEVRVAGDTSLYAIHEIFLKSKLHYQFNRVKANPLGYVLSRPTTWIGNSYRYVRRVIRYGNWRPYTYPFKKQISKLRFPPAYEGYLTTNKPKYRPGDTLHYSAWLTTAKGRPLKRSLRLKLYNGGRSIYRSITVSPAPNGRYEGSIWLDPDKLKLDRKLKLEFYTRGNRDVNPSLTLEYSDYETSELQLRLQCQQTFKFADSVHFQVEANDVNGYPVATGQPDSA